MWMPKLILWPLVGGAFGFLMYRVIGCSTGHCPITANPIVSTIYGVVLGLLVALS